MRHTITICVNGEDETLEVEPSETLLAALRERLDLTGAKEGCNEGECGACVVLLDGKAVNGCLTLAVEADGREVTTIEGLGDWWAAHGGADRPAPPAVALHGPRSVRLHPLQEAFLKLHAVQCGFCTPGMILTAAALLADNPAPTEAEVRTALAGNLCRCTGYRQILDAVHEAAAAMRATPAAPSVGRVL